MFWKRRMGKREMKRGKSMDLLGLEGMMNGVNQISGRLKF